jgi:hypothetical protein
MLPRPGWCGDHADADLGSLRRLAMVLNRMVVPVVILVGVICFIAGAAAGVLAMFAASLQEVKDPPQTGFEIHGLPTAPSPPPPPSAKEQLVALVAKLEQATREPVVILSAKQRSKLREQLQGLDTTANLSDEEAQKRLDAIQEIVKGEQAKLDAAGGGRRGGGGGPGIAPPVTNPFVVPPNHDHLTDLQKRLDREE